MNERRKLNVNKTEIKNRSVWKEYKFKKISNTKRNKVFISLNETEINAGLISAKNTLHTLD
jgi:hypothetical protein